MASLHGGGNTGDAPFHAPSVVRLALFPFSAARDNSRVNAPFKRVFAFDDEQTADEVDHGYNDREDEWAAKSEAPEEHAAKDRA